MNTLSARLLVISVTLVLVSCDPAKILVLKTEDQKNSSVTIYTNNKFLPFGSTEDEGKLVIHIPHNDTTEKTFYYGLGGWTKEGIANLASNVDSIVIINRTGKTALSAETEIHAYLIKHRSGYLKRVLKIVAE